MTVIGFDPGSVCFGVAILNQDGDRITRVHSGVLRLKGMTFDEKMNHLLTELTGLYDQFPLQHAGIEEAFLGKNVRSLTLLAQVRGVVMASLILRGIPHRHYTPREIKKAVTGSGNASKDQVQRMMKILLKLGNDWMAGDESDALAVAYCDLLGSGRRR